MNYDYEVNQPDGSCFLEPIAKKMVSSDSYSEAVVGKIKELRNDIYMELTQNSGQYIEHFASVGGQTYEQFARLVLGTEYMNNIYIQALANRLRLKFVIYHHNANNPTIVMPVGADPHDNLPTYTYAYNVYNQHYDSLVPIEAVNMDVELSMMWALPQQSQSVTAPSVWEDQQQPQPDITRAITYDSKNSDIEIFTNAVEKLKCVLLVNHDVVDSSTLGVDRSDFVREVWGKLRNLNSNQPVETVDFSLHKTDMLVGIRPLATGSLVVQLLQPLHELVRTIFQQVVTMRQSPLLLMQEAGQFGSTLTNRMRYANKRLFALPSAEPKSGERVDLDGRYFYVLNLGEEPLHIMRHDRKGVPLSRIVLGTDEVFLYLSDEAAAFTPYVLAPSEKPVLVFVASCLCYAEARRATFFSNKESVAAYVRLMQNHVREVPFASDEAYRRVYEERRWWNLDLVRNRNNRLLKQMLADNDPNVAAWQAFFEPVHSDMRATANAVDPAMDADQQRKFALYSAWRQDFGDDQYSSTNIANVATVPENVSECVRLLELKPAQ